MAKLTNSIIGSWTPDVHIERWAKKAKFGPAIDFTDRELRMLRKQSAKPPVGLYMWESENHEIYIGISNASVTTRLRQHAVNYPKANIRCFRYRPADGDRTALRGIERELIHSAVDAGFTVFNREHSATIFGESVFDDLVPVDRQAAWLDNMIAENKADGPLRQRKEEGTKKFEQQFQTLMARPDAERIVEAVAVYLTTCVPFPRTTEGQFWSMSCLPSWSSKRLVTLNMAFLEMLYFHQEPGSNRVEVHIGTDYRFLPRHWQWMKLRRLGVRRSGGPQHRSGGPNEECLYFTSIDAFITVMTRSPEIREAAGRFALDRMRKSRISGRYLAAHNVLFAEAALTLNPESATEFGFSRRRQGCGPTKVPLTSSSAGGQSFNPSSASILSNGIVGSLCDS